MPIEYENKFFNVVKNEGYYAIEEPLSKNAAAVLLEDKKRGFVLVKVYRPALKKTVYEIPRGYAEACESPEFCAAREVQEETGYHLPPSHFIKLGAVNPNSGILSSSINIFYASTCITDRLSMHDNESEGIVYFQLGELLLECKNGNITDSFTLSALSLYLITNKF